MLAMADKLGKDGGCHHSLRDKVALQVRDKKVINFRHFLWMRPGDSTETVGRETGSLAQYLRRNFDQRLVVIDCAGQSCPIIVLFHSMLQRLFFRANDELLERGLDLSEHGN